jgi:tetratricopeptide (TPR) repeat protein
MRSGGDPEILSRATEKLRERERVRWILGTPDRPESPGSLEISGTLDLTSHLTHNMNPQRSLIEDLATALASILHGVDRIIIPRLEDVDFESLKVLKALYRRPKVPKPELWIAGDLTADEETPDERGLLKGYPRHLQQKMCFAFRGAGVLETLPAEGLESASTEATCSAPNEEDRLLMVPGGSDLLRLQLARHWFLAYGFTSALTLGLDLLERNPELSPTELAELHHLVGLAAHNRQFGSTSDKRLERFLHILFSKAFELETDPTRQTALCYRLAVVCGRRLGRLEEAGEWVERGLALCSQLPALDAAYQAAWCRNIRSYIHLRRGEKRRALVDTEESFAILAPFVNSRRQIPEEALSARDLDILATGQLLADHAVALSVACGDLARGEIWQQKVRELFLTLPAVEYLDVEVLLELCRSSGEVQAALVQCERACGQAAASFDFLRELELTWEAAIFAARLGDYQRAAELLTTAYELRERLGRPAGTAPVEGPLAWALIHARKGQTAEALIIAALADPALVRADARAELLALSAACAVEVGDALGALERINAAIDAAVDSGREGTLVRTALAAGDIALGLGDLALARQAFTQATELLEESLNDPGSAYPAEWARLAAGLWRAGVRETEDLYPWTAAALGRAEQALKAPQVWSLLDFWSEAIRACNLDDEAGGPDLASGWRALKKAQSERLAHVAAGSR